MRTGNQARPGGFTLVELLVVIAIIGVMVGLLLPAVQAAREAARRMSCSNNLKQLGLAIHNYESTFRTFPFSWMVTSPTGGLGPGINAQVWGLQVLPFMEQQPLYDRFDTRVPAFNEAAGLGFPPAVVAQNIEIVQTVIPGFICPSAPGSGESRVYDFNYAPTFPITGRVAPSDYCVASGVRGAYSNIAYANFAAANRHGALQYGGQTITGIGTARTSKMSEILDGTANTILLGERFGGGTVWVGKLPRTQNPYNLLGAANGGGWGDILNGEHWPAGSIQNETAPLEGPCIINCTNRRGAGFHSFHPGGAMFVMADASVQFVSESVEAFRFAAAITRAGGEPISLDN